MKSIKYILLSIAMTISFSAIANDEINKTCNVVHEIAVTAMMLRQDNYPIPYVIEMAQGNKLVVALVEAAYQVPLYEDYDTKLEAVKEFSNGAQVQCYKTLSMKKSI